MSEQQLEATGTPNEETVDTVETETQAETKMFTQDDIDKIVKERLDRERKRYEKKYADVDVDRYRELTEREEAERMEQHKQRGEFEKVLQETVSKKDAAIQDMQKQLTEIKVDGSLLNAASSRRAINAQQVSALLKNQVRLGDTGDAEVVDANGAVRYTEQGTAMTVDNLVEEFLNANPHFISAGPAGSGAKSNVSDSKGMGNIDPSQLNMNNPEDRKVYKEYMKSRGIRI